jgi:uncharacterized protein
MGTLINILSILGGSALGLLVRARLPERYVKTVFQALGLFTVFLGIKLALETQQVLVLILSLVLGSILGEAMCLDQRIEAVGKGVKRKLGERGGGGRFAEGLSTSFLLFGIGPMSTLGALQEGLGEGIDILLTKSLLDGIASIALAAGLGVGVAFSSIPVGVYQGLITVLALGLQPLLTDAAIAEVSAVGGVTLVGLGLNLLKVAELKVMNMLPGLFFALPLSWLVSGC